MRKAGLILGVLMGVTTIQAQTILIADGVGDTYELINSVLTPEEGDVVEVPDCSHEEFGRHIDEVFDSILMEWVFRFHIHVTPDNDRCKNFDRQRNEIKTYSSSPDSTKGVEGEIVTYKWKFKIDTGSQSSSAFTHIHQLKAVGGSEESMPLITLTTRLGSPDKLQVRYAENTSQTTIKQVELDPFKGNWVQAYEKVKYGERGTYYLLLTNIVSGDTLLEYTSDDIRMWKTRASFMRPKWGIYRSLDHPEDLRDEEVLFDEFYIIEDADTTIPTVDLSSTASEPAVGDFQIKIDFSKKIIGLEESDFIVDGGEIVNQSISSSNNINYTAMVTPLLPGTISILLPDSAVVDADGRYNLASNILEVRSDPDTTSPTIGLSASATEPVSDTFGIAIDFREEISGLAEIDLIIEGGELVDESLYSPNNINFTALILPQISGTVSIHIPGEVVADGVGNLNLPSDTLRVRAELSATLTGQVMESEIKIYPNPASSNIITIHNKNESGNLEIRILNILGKKV